MDLPLWEALGRPPHAAWIPGGRSPTWNAARQLLRRALPDPPAPIPRSGTSQWNLLHHGSAPARVSWGLMCNGYTVGDLAAALQAHHDNVGANGVTVASWNIRWLVDTLTSQAAAKRTVIMSNLLRQRVVILQETHWNPAAAALWTANFPAATVAHSCAIVGPGGGWQGGVAVIVPAGTAITEVNIIAPGCAIEVIIDRAGTRFCIWAVYLPPRAGAPSG